MLLIGMVLVLFDKALVAIELTVDSFQHVRFVDKMVKVKLGF